MYSPKIHEDLIPNLYKLSKAQQQPMTKFVNYILEQGINSLIQNGTCLILNWTSVWDVSIVTEEDGTPAFFNTKQDAEQYAQEELNFHWQVIRLQEEG